MTLTIAFRRLATLAPAVAAFACATGHRSAMPADDRARPASDVPTAFTFLTPAAGDACRNPAVDPRDQTRLVLVRAASGRGDYAVPAGRYGVGAADLLRLTCATGAVVGIVPR